MEVLLFGITREIVGASTLTIPAEETEDVGALRNWLKQTYPQFHGLSSLAIAVNGEYADDNMSLTGTEEIALIPPVSGG